MIRKVLVYSCEKMKDRRFYCTKDLSYLFHCTSSAIEELILDNDAFISDCECYSAMKMLQYVQDKKIGVMVPQPHQHLFLTDLLLSEEGMVYENADAINRNQSLKGDEYRIIDEPTLCSGSLSWMHRFKIRRKNKKMKKNNKKRKALLRKEFMSKRAKAKEKNVLLKKIRMKLHDLKKEEDDDD